MTHQHVEPPPCPLCSLRAYWDKHRALGRPTPDVGWEDLDVLLAALERAEARIKDLEAALESKYGFRVDEHLRHMTDGKWHDDCGYCLQRRRAGGTGIPQLDAERKRVKELEAALQLMLACIDNIGLIDGGANGNVHDGIDEGMVLTARAIEAARRVLGEQT